MLGSEIELHETSAFEHIDIVEGVQYDVGDTFMIRIVGSSKKFTVSLMNRFRCLFIMRAGPGENKINEQKRNFPLTTGL